MVSIPCSNSKPAHYSGKDSEITPGINRKSAMTERQYLPWIQDW